MKLRVLFVEDTADDVELMLRRLREAGIEAQWQRVETADALREALAGEPWELALVDYNLPGFGGLEALAALAALAPDLPAVTVSGAISEETAVATITAGAVDYVLKSNLTRLAPAALRAVEGAALRRRQRRAAAQARQTQYAIDHSSQAIIYLSEGGTVLYANAAAERLGGVPADEAVGQQIWAWSHVVDEPRWAALWRAAAQRPIVDFEAPISLPGGEELLISATLDYHERDEDAFVIVYARDITAQRAVEERAAESEARYGRLTDNAADIIFRYDFVPTLGLTYINPAVEATTGYTPDDCYADPQLMFTMVHPDDAASMAELMASLTPPDEPLLMRWIGKDGVTRWMESRLVPVRDAEGRLLAVEGVTRDVTGRKQAEEALRRRERELSTLLGNAPDMIVRFDTDLRYVYCNAAVEGQLGDLARTLIGKTPLETGYPREEAEVVCRALRQALETGDEQVVEQDLSTPSGQKHFATRIVPERDEQGSIESLLAIARDITERKHAEAALRQSEERFRRVSEATSDFAYSCVKSPGGSFHFDWLSGAVERITGWSRDEVFERGCWKALVLEEDVPLFEARVTGPAPGGSGVCELRIRDKQGGVRWLAAYSAVEQDAEDPAVHLLHGACQDITARKQAEEDIRRQAEQLRRTVEGAVLALGLVVETRDPYTAGHERRVSELATAIAREMGMAGEALDALRLGGLIHDIGKIAVPAEILSKPGVLSEVEFNLIKQHPQAGFEILAAIDFGLPVAEMVLQHHERLDGSGYPRGLAGADLLPEARILAVADVVEAMSSHRPYRAALGMEAALAEVRAHAGVKYDAAVVATCVRLVEEQGFVFTP